MPDREKVIERLEYCAETRDGYVRDCINDALDLLKEQEAVKPRVSMWEQRCGNCNKVIEMDGWKSCPWCGKPIDWEGR